MPSRAMSIALRAKPGGRLVPGSWKFMTTSVMAVTVRPGATVSAAETKFAKNRTCSS